MEKGFQKLEKLLIYILAKLTTRKKHKLSRHVPPLKQLNFFSMLVDIMTNNTQYTSTELIYTQHPLVTHWRKLNLLLYIVLIINIITLESLLGLPPKNN